MGYDDPRKIGIFEFVKDEENYIISKQPLNFEQVINLINTNMKFEAYFEENDYLLTQEYLEELIKLTSKIKYYTKQKIFFENKEEDEDEDGNIINNIEKLILEVKEDYSGFKIVNLKGYINKQSKNFYKSLIKKLAEILSLLNSDKTALFFSFIRSAYGQEIIIPKVFDNLKIEYQRDKHYASEVVKILENALKIKNKKVYISVKERSYDFYIFTNPEDNSITFGIGYDYAKYAGFSEFKKVLANSDEAKEIVKKFKEWYESTKK
jgi:hypothetical protein